MVHRNRRRLGALVASFFMLMALAVPAMGATESKPYSAAATGSVDAGFDGTVSVSITNLTDPQPIGSANITVPAELNVGGTHPSVIELRNLGILPGETRSFPISVRAQCTPATAEWTIEVKQSNDFNGTGNDFFLEGDQPTTSIDGTCSLAFTSQPASAERYQTITGAPYDPAGPAVAVTVFDGGGDDPVEWWSQDITLALGLDASGGTATLGGTTTGSPVAGVATFAPTLDVSAFAYTLSVSSGDGTAVYPAVSTTSTPFDIVDDADLCLPGYPCTATSSKSSTSVTISASAGTEEIPLTVSIDPADLFVLLDAGACQGYEGVSGTVQFFVEDASRSKTVSITIDADAVDRPLKKFEVCFATPVPADAEPFTTKDGTPAQPLTDSVGNFVTINGFQIYSGLLPDCELPAPGPPGSNEPPCVGSRDRDKTTKDVTVTFEAPASDLDPWGKI
jgi:hypothetical protein